MSADDVLVIQERPDGHIVLLHGFGDEELTVVSHHASIRAAYRAAVEYCGDRGRPEYGIQIELRDK